MLHFCLFRKLVQVSSSMTAKPPRIRMSIEKVALWSTTDLRYNIMCSVWQNMKHPFSEGNTAGSPTAHVGENEGTTSEGAGRRREQGNN